MLVELKNGETLNGHLVSCDNWMNLTLKEVVQTSPVSLTPQLCRGQPDCKDGPVSVLDMADVLLSQDGDKFFRLPEVYVRGNNVSLC